MFRWFNEQGFKSNIRDFGGGIQRFACNLGNGCAAKRMA
jgi:hypothetical protein